MKAINQREYWDEIRSIAKDALDDYRDFGSEENPNEWLSDWVHTALDQHRWLIYTFYLSQVMTFTDNDDAYFDSYGPLEASSYSDAMTKMAYAAMEADLMDHLDIDDFEAIYYGEGD